LQAFALPERADAALNGVLTAFEGVKESFGDCSFFGFIPGDFIDIVDADEPVAELEEGVTEDLLGIEGCPWFVGTAATVLDCYGMIVVLIRTKRRNSVAVCCRVNAHGIHPACRLA